MGQSLPLSLDFQNSRGLTLIHVNWRRYLTLDPYVARYNNQTKGEIYGDKELYNYNTAVSFDTETYPVARFVNEVRTILPRLFLTMYG